MTQENEMIENLFHEAHLICRTYMTNLETLYTPTQAVIYYQKFLNYIIEHRIERIKEAGYEGLREIIEKDLLKYAGIIHESAGYAMEKVKEEDKNGLENITADSSSASRKVGSWLDRSKLKGWRDTEL